MSELTRIADNEDATWAYAKFWGDRYVESDAALKIMRSLLVVRLETAEIKLAGLERTRAALITGTSVPTEGT